MYFYSSRPFIELMLAQPVLRRDLAIGLLIGSAAPLAGGFVVGAGAPLAVHGAFTGETARAIRASGSQRQGRRPGGQTPCPG